MQYIIIFLQNLQNNLRLSTNLSYLWITLFAKKKNKLAIGNFMFPATGKKSYFCSF